MACEEKFRPLLSAWIDGELTEEEADALRTHLDSCPACRRELENLRLMQEELAGLEEEPPARVADGVMTSLYSKKKRRFFVGPGTLIGAAAAVLVLLVAYGKLPFLNKQAKQEKADSTEYNVEARAADAEEELPEAMLMASQSTDVPEPEFEDDVADEETPMELAEADEAAPVEEPEAPAPEPSEAPAEPESAPTSAEGVICAYVEIYNYSDSLPIEELESRTYEMDGDNLVYYMTVAEARELVATYETTHSMYTNFEENCSDDATAQVTVMP